MYMCSYFIQTYAIRGSLQCKGVEWIKRGSTLGCLKIHAKMPGMTFNAMLYTIVVYLTVYPSELFLWILNLANGN
jgi:hypothetical protein